MRDLKLISCLPDQSSFVWQTAVNLLNAREYGFSDKAQVLVFLSHDQLHKGFNGKWKFLERKFPETQFFYYPDTENITKIMTTFEYIPLLRLQMLQKHWKKFPELKEKAIYYHDSDTVFTKYPTFLDSFKDDDINYLSETRSYLNADYFERKREEVLPEKKEIFSGVDPLAKVAKITGTTKQTWIDNKDNTGGAQYLLKDIDLQFWIDCFNESISIRTYLMDINRRFFASEEKGYQSWVADMLGLIGNLWKRGRKVITPKEMDFAWASQYTEEWENRTIYHDASAFPDPFEKDKKTMRTFFKRGNRIKIDNYEFFDYMLDWEAPMLKTPFEDDLSYVSPELCSYKYCQEIARTKEFLFK